MKIYKLIAVCLAISSISFAQTTVTARILPIPGDTITFVVDTNFSSVKVTPAGIDQFWDFSSLGVITYRKDIYREPSQGQGSASFPMSNLMLRSNGQERYYISSSSGLNELGTYTQSGGPIPGFGGANIYPTIVKVLKLPLNYGDTYTGDIPNLITLPSNLLPDSLLNMLPLKFDSFRIKNVQSIEHTVDAWGKVKLPRRTWSVLREKVVTQNKNTVEVLIGFIGWVDVTTLAEPLLQGLLDIGTTYNYRFWSDEAKGPVLSISADSTGNMLSIQYKGDPFAVSSEDLNFGRVSFSLLNNPLYIGQKPKISLNQGDVDIWKGVVSIMDLNGRIIRVFPEISIYSKEPVELNWTGEVSSAYIIQCKSSNNQVYNLPLMLIGR